MSISEDDHEKLDVGSKEIIEENTSKDSIREKEREKSERREIKRKREKSIKIKKAVIERAF